ncbi:hypothetical protein J6590_019953 [Homalodisca vitripennis]|nr:hypothetical protein J6590_019953 [Homalodisca vitripennis]
MMASVLPLVWKSEVQMLSRHRLPDVVYFGARDCRSVNEKHRLPDVIYFGAYNCRSVNKKYDDGKCIASGMEIGGTDVVQIQAPGCRLFRGS